MGKCEHCGDAIGRPRGGGRKNRFCSRECFFAFRRASSRNAVGPFHKCQLCAYCMEVIFTPSRYKAADSDFADACMCCESAMRKSVARRDARTKYYQPQRPDGYACDSCGDWFYGAGKYCDTCRSEVRSSKHIARAIRYGCEWECFSSVAVWERDNWTCQDCGRTVERLEEYAPHQATLDHVIPLSKGGPHTEENAQTLCHECNSAKRDKLLVLF